MFQPTPGSLCLISKLAQLQFRPTYVFYVMPDFSTTKMRHHVIEIDCGQAKPNFTTLVDVTIGSAPADCREVEYGVLADEVLQSIFRGWASRISIGSWLGTVSNLGGILPEEKARLARLARPFIR